MVNSTHLIVAACLMFAAAASGAVQSPPAKVVTTASGVYTAAQAGRGEQTYMNICVACHPAGTYTTPVFREKWNGSPVSELFGLISNTMPKMEPGSLTPEEYSDAVAYLLKINGAPTGKAELPAEIKALRRIRIVMPSGSGKRVGK
jgi:mono/diheme cytochrome c family protein